MGNIQAVIDLPEQLYLSLSGFGLTKERIANESRKLLALKYFKEKVLSLGRSAELSGLDYIPQEVFKEVVEKGKGKPGSHLS